MEINEPLSRMYPWVIDSVKRNCRDYHTIVGVGDKPSVVDLISVPAALCGEVVRFHILGNRDFGKRTVSEKKQALIMKVLWGQAKIDVSQAPIESVFGLLCGYLKKLGLFSCEVLSIDEIKKIGLQKERPTGEIPLDLQLSRTKPTLPPLIVAASLRQDVWSVARDHFKEHAYLLAMRACSVASVFAMKEAQGCFVPDNKEADMKIAQRILFGSVYWGAVQRPQTSKEVNEHICLLNYNGPIQ